LELELTLGHVVVLEDLVPSWISSDCVNQFMERHKTRYNKYRWSEI